MIIIDISVSIKDGMPVWPNSPDVCLESTMSIERGDEVNLSKLKCDVHAGTHIDAPLHFIDGGASVDELPLETLCGPVYVLEVTGVEVITGRVLESAKIPSDVKRLLFKSSNSALWNKGVFDPDYIAIDKDAAKWVVDKGIRLVGIDYLSIEAFKGGGEVHRLLLGSEVVVLEGLDMSGAEQGWYDLICMPLKLSGAEGAPARAVLRSVERGVGYDD